MNDTTTLYAMVAGLSLGFATILHFLHRMIARSLDAGKDWIITVPDTPGSWATIERRRVAKSAITRKSGDEGETRILQGDAAYPTRRGPLHIVSAYGANLVAPTKDEAADKDGPLKERPVVFQRFRIWDPLTYWRATKENDMEDLYSAQKEKDHWAIKLAPIAVILFVVLMGALGFLLWKLYPLLERAGQ